MFVVVMFVIVSCCDSCYKVLLCATQGAFVIDNGTGVITVSNNALLDREGMPGHDTHTITVRAFDGLHNS